MSSYIRAVNEQYNKGKYTLKEVTYFRNTYQKATPEEKKALDYKHATPEEKKAMEDRTNYQIQNESNSKTSEQKTLEAIRSNTSTIVNIMLFYLVLTILSILFGLYTLSQL
jgi:hypothetical protein